MIEIFKDRKEKLTILHFPLTVSPIKQCNMLEKITNDVSIPLHSKISYFIRHNQKIPLLKILSKKENIEYIEKISLNQHLIDLAYTDDPETEEILFKYVAPFIGNLKTEELMYLSKAFYKKKPTLQNFISKIPNNDELFLLATAMLFHTPPKKDIEKFFEMTPHRSELLSKLLFFAFRSKEDENTFASIPQQLEGNKFITTDVLEAVQQRYMNLKEGNENFCCPSFMDTLERFKEKHFSESK